MNTHKSDTKENKQREILASGAEYVAIDTPEIKQIRKERARAIVQRILEAEKEESNKGGI